MVLERIGKLNGDQRGVGAAAVSATAVGALADDAVDASLMRVGAVPAGPARAAGGHGKDRCP